MPPENGIFAAFGVRFGQAKGEDLLVDGFWRVDYFRRQVEGRVEARLLSLRLLNRICTKQQRTIDLTINGCGLKRHQSHY